MFCTKEKNGSSYRSKPVRVLELLLERHGDTVPREEIMARFWSSTAVDPKTNLHTAVKKIRDALGDPKDSLGISKQFPNRLPF